MYSLKTPTYETYFSCSLSSKLHIYYFSDYQMAKKVVVKIMIMDDEKTKQKAMEAVADIHGVDSIAADLKEQKLTITGEMDIMKVAKRLKKIGKIEIELVGPAEDEEKREEKKDEENKDENKMTASV